MESSENIEKCHNFYLVGKNNFELGTNSGTNDFSAGTALGNIGNLPLGFRFRDTLDEIGFNIRLNYDNVKHIKNKDDESIFVFDSFKFKDFDIVVSNPWDFFEFQFTQRYLSGVSFGTSKFNIQEQLVTYLSSIYGDYTVILDTKVWYPRSEQKSTVLYLEIEEKYDGKKYLSLTFYDRLLEFHTEIYNCHKVIRDDEYERDKLLISRQPDKSFLKSVKNIFKVASSEPSEPQFSIKKEEILNSLRNDDSINNIKIISSFLLNNINIRKLNLEDVDFLFFISELNRKYNLLEIVEKIYELIVEWYNCSEFVPTKERIILVASAYKDLINISYEKNEFQNAIEHFEGCLKIINLYKITIGGYHYLDILGQANYNLARIYFNKKEYQHAIEHVQKALDYYEPLATPWISEENLAHIILAFMNLGNYLAITGKYDEANKTHIRGIKFSTDNNRFVEAGYIHMNFAITLVEQKNYEEAEKEYYNILNVINGSPHLFLNSTLNGQVLVNMADLYEEISNTEKEFKFLYQAILYYKELQPKHPELNDLIKNLEARHKR